MIGNIIRYKSYINLLNVNEFRTEERLVVDAYVDNRGRRLYKVEMNYLDKNGGNVTRYIDIEAYLLVKVISFANLKLEENIDKHLL